MRVLVDTSVWADFFNEAPTPQAEVLTRLIENEVEIVTCGVIIAEFFQGIRKATSVEPLERQFRDMDCLTPNVPDTYFKAAELYRALRKSGITIRSTIDCLIVCLAELHDVLLLSSDGDIRRIIDSGLTGAEGVPV